MRSLRPSQVRARIIGDHEGLRRQLDELSQLGAKLQAGDDALFAQALARAQALYDTLRDHIDFEDDLLGPALREADAWGVLRAERLAHHHAEQRQQLRELDERCRSESPQGLACLLDALIEELRADMAFEEESVLSPEILRDDVIAVDGEDG